MKVSSSISAETKLTGKDDVDWAKSWLDEILREDEFFVSPASKPAETGAAADMRRSTTDPSHSIVQQASTSEPRQP